MFQVDSEGMSALNYGNFNSLNDTRISRSNIIGDVRIIGQIKILGSSIQK